MGIVYDSAEPVRRTSRNTKTLLSQQGFEALETLLAGAERAAKRQGVVLLSGRSGQELFHSLLITVLRIVFVLFAQGRGLLPAHASAYRQGFCLAHLLDGLDGTVAQPPAWPRLFRLFEALHCGHTDRDFRLPARGGDLFDPRHHGFVSGLEVDNTTVQKLLDKLLRVGGVPLDFGQEDVELLGHLHEALLGYTVVCLKGPAVAVSLSGRRDAPLAWVEIQPLLRHKELAREGWLKAQLGLETAMSKKISAAVKGISLEDPGGLDRGLERLLPLSRTEPRASGAHVLQPNKERKTRGAHYTPRALASSVARTALSHVETQSAAQILSLRICDPAMGSGVFLNEVCRQLGKTLAKAWEADNGAPSDQDTKARRAVARTCLFGVDQSPLAVTLAKMSLWLVARSAELPFTFADRQLRHGDSLAPQTDHKAMGLFSPELGQRFDVLLGNPPYVSFYGRGSQVALFPPGYKDLLARLHSTIDGTPAMSGRLNTFVCFCVKCANQVSDRGVVSLVLPDAVLTNESYKALRHALVSTGRLLGADRYGDDLFEGAAVGTAVLTYGPPRPTKDRSARLRDVKCIGGSGEDLVLHEPLEAFAFRPSLSLFPISTAKILSRTVPERGSSELGQVARVRDGINSGSKRTRLTYLTDVHDGDPSLRPCMEGRWISPYQVIEERLWVRYAPERLSAQDRKEGASLGDRGFFDAPKIVYRQTAPHIIAAVDAVGRCYRNSVHGILPTSGGMTVLHALCAYLNSAFFRDYYQAVTGETRRTFPQVHITSVKRLRVPNTLMDENSSSARELARLAKKMSEGRDNTKDVEARINSIVRAAVDALRAPRQES